MVLNKCKERFKNIIIIILFFLYVFDVNIFPIEMINLMTYIGVIIIGLDIITNKKVYIPKAIYNIIKYILPFIGWVLFVEMLHGILEFNKMIFFLSQFSTIFMPFFRIFIVCYIICRYLKINIIDWEKKIFIIGIIQLICVILAFISNPIKQAFNNLTIHNGHSENLINFILMNNQRCFGLADNLFDSFGYITAIIIVLVFINAVDNSKKYFPIFFLMLIMPLLNARTGLVLISIGCIITMGYYMNRVLLKDFGKYIMMICIAVFVAQFFWKYIPKDTMTWITKGTTAIYNLIIYGEKTSTFSQLDEMIIFPSNLLIGDGAAVEIISKGFSDIGYIRLIWQTGIIGTVIYVVSMILLFWREYRISSTKQMKCYIICLCAIYFIYLYKLYSLGNAGANCLIFGTFVVNEVAYVHKNNYIQKRTIK